MTITALAIIQDGYARLNRLSPGETLGADEAAFAFARLNLLVDEMGADGLFLYKDGFTSAVQTGATLTLGAGSWLAIAPGAEIVGAVLVSTTNGNFPLAPITMQQYAEQIALPATASLPALYAYDGLATVYLYPVPTAQTIQLQTRTGVAAFADQTTAYTVPPGYQSYLGAALAGRLAPSVLGSVPPDIRAAAKAGAVVLGARRPSILDVYSYTQASRRESILNGT